MKKITYIALFFILISCNYFEKKKISLSDDLIQQKMDKINRTQIDRYPIFKACEEINYDLEAEKSCFTSTLSNHITNYLSVQEIELHRTLQDTLHIRLQINDEGAVAVKEYSVSEKVMKSIPNIRSLISNSIQELPQIEPAVKKIPETGDLIPVTTQFVIPIVISE